MPQSMTSTSPNSPSMTLDGLRSRWIRPRAWANATAWQTCSNTPTQRGRSSAGVARAASSSARVWPWISFITKNGRPSGSSPRS